MQRLSIARAMMHDPEVLFLDEPSAGLDPQTRLLLWEIIRDYNRAGQDHRPHHALHGRGRRAVPDRLAIIDHGRIIAQGTPAGAEIVHPRRLPAAPAVRPRARAPCSTELREAAGRHARCAPADHAAADVYADRGGPLIPAIVSRGAGRGRGAARRPHRRAEPGNPVPASHRKEFARLNWKTFYALLSRDGHVARRNLLPMLLQNLLQPLLLTFVFGRVLTSSGMMQAGYKRRAAARHHGHQHGDLGSPGRGHAADRRVSVHARDRRPPAGAHGERLAGGGESGRRHDPGAGGRPGGDSRGVAD